MSWHCSAAREDASLMLDVANRKRTADEHCLCNDSTGLLRDQTTLIELELTTQGLVCQREEFHCPRLALELGTKVEDQS